MVSTDLDMGFRSYDFFQGRVLMKFPNGLAILSSWESQIPNNETGLCEVQQHLSETFGDLSGAP